MSFKGKVVERKEIDSPFGKIELTKKEYEPFPRRSKVIFWMGECKVVQLGKLITIYHIKSRKSDLEPVKYEPFYYKVELNENADPSEIEDMFFLLEEIEIEGGKRTYEFDDDKIKADEFIQGVKCKGVEFGGINVDSQTEFERWKTALEKLLDEN